MNGTVKKRDSNELNKLNKPDDQHRHGQLLNQLKLDRGFLELQRQLFGLSMMKVVVRMGDVDENGAFVVVDESNS